MVLLVYFCLLFLIAFPLGEFSRVTVGLVVSVSLLDVVVVLSNIVWLGKKVYQHAFVRSPQAKWFGLVVGVFCLSLLVNGPHLSLTQLGTSALYIVRFFIYGNLFFISKTVVGKRKQQVEKLLLFGGMLLLLGGYVQYFFYPSLRNLIYFGWDEHFYRMFGTFFDPNFFGLFLTLLEIFIFSKILTNQAKQQRILLGIFAFLTFIAIILTYSRTALIALFVGVLVLFWNKKRLRYLFLVFFAISIMGISIISLIPKATQTNTIFREFSAGARMGSAQDAFTIFLDNPLLGVGFNAYRYSMYAHHFQPGTSMQEDHGASGADSSLLLVLATSGIVGLGVFLTFLWIHLRILAKQKDKLGVATLVAWLVGSFFVNGLFYPLLLVWVWVVLGFTEYDGQ